MTARGEVFTLSGDDIFLSNEAELVPGADTVFPKVVADSYFEWSIGDRGAGDLVAFGDIGDSIQDGLKVVEFITRIVFRYVERMIDVVGQFFIDSGRWMMRPVLSGAHNGMYGNYLCWAVVGFLFVLFYLFGSALLG